MSQLSSARFRRDVDAAVAHVRALLGASRNPSAFPPDAPHTYADKYSLVEIGSRQAKRAARAALDIASDGGFSRTKATLDGWAGAGQVVTLAIQSEETCAFDKTTVRDVQSKTQHVVESRSSLFGTSKTTLGSVTTVTEHFWDAKTEWEIFAFAGADPAAPGQKVVLCAGAGSCRLKTVADQPRTPRPALKAGIDARCEITDFVKPAEFTIDRSDAKCHTPRRNEQVDALLKQLQALAGFASSAKQYLCNIQPRGALDEFGVCSNRQVPHPRVETYLANILDPIAASFTVTQGGCLEDGAASTGAESKSTAVGSAAPSADHALGVSVSLTPTTADADAFIVQLEKSAEEAVIDMAKVLAASAASPSCPNGHVMEKSDFTGGNYVDGRWFCDRCSTPATGERWFCRSCSADICFNCVAPNTSTSTSVCRSVYTIAAARATLGCALLSKFRNTHQALVDAVEAMLSEQICSAIGKTVEPSDFAEYMDFHNAQLFRDGLKPRGFCHAIRRPGAYPEGTLSIETVGSGGKALPIKCISAHRTSDGSAAGAIPPIKFPLSAAADLTFYGDQYLHSFVQHKFARSGSGKVQLAARARQFSSFVLLIGKLSGPGTFAPESAIIIKNKDELVIPLLLETIPTPKEFRDAIESLSPEQQDFCRSFRAMQLSSTLFSMAVIQIKPQLERVLNLPSNLLTKEVKLTQDLMQLFIEYQISPDLLAYEPDMDGGESGESKTSSTARSRAIASVKANVGQIKEFISEEKNLEIEQHMAEQAKQLELNQLKQTARSFQEGGFGSGGGGFSFGAAPVAPAAPMARGGPMPGGAAPRSKRRGAPHPTSALGGMVMSSASMAAPPSALRSKGMNVVQDASAPSNASTTMAKTATATATSDNGNQAATGQPSSPSKASGDWTAIPKRMDATFEKFDSDAALRPTIIKTKSTWSRTRQDGLLSKPKRDVSFAKEKQKTARNEAFDLLDALTRSGAMPILTGASLHVVMATTHCFDKTLMATLVQDNVNPIDKVERSQLIVASLIHGAPVRALVEESAVERLTAHCPMLLAE